MDPLAWRSPPSGETIAELMNAVRDLTSAQNPREARNSCVLNGGTGSWAFEPLAHLLSAALGIPVSAVPHRYNYLLHIDSPDENFSHEVFIPLPSIHIAADKRLIAEAFSRHKVPTPLTELVDSFAEVTRFVREHADLEWCLKFPTGCGASGHRLVNDSLAEPRNWPKPYILQEFIRLELPKVYRLFCAGGDIFGWVERSFPDERPPSPWVAHARGARYVRLERDAPEEAINAARSALKAAGLFESFGCVDLICRPSGQWLVLEVGTDGIYNHVDRELDNPELESEIQQRIADAFWRQASKRSA